MARSNRDPELRRLYWLFLDVHELQGLLHRWLLRVLKRQQQQKSGTQDAKLVALLLQVHQAEQKIDARLERICQLLQEMDYDSEDAVYGPDPAQQLSPFQEAARQAKKPPGKPN